MNHPWQHLSSFLFVPGDQAARFSKAAHSAAEAVIVDLEDAVSPANKPMARAQLAEAVAIIHAANKPALVRINHDLLHISADLTAALLAGVDGIVLPKASDASLLNLIMQTLQAAGNHHTTLLALIESPSVIANQAQLLALANVPGVQGLSLGTEDYAASLGVAPTTLSLHAAVTAIILAAKSAGKSAYVLPRSIADYQGLDAWQSACSSARAMGASGALCIHPKQCEATNAAYAPQPAEIAWAEAVVASSLEREAHESAAWAVNGQMIDAPVLARAQAVLQRAMRS
jgi:citrate lyase subunit beta / citryl-CoA lyase